MRAMKLYKPRRATRLFDIKQVSTALYVQEQEVILAHFAHLLDGKTIELCDFSGWTEGIHRGFVSNALINKYSIIQGPKVIFVNLVMTTEDEKVLCFLIKVYRRSYM